jgi:hypothetical protein
MNPPSPFESSAGYLPEEIKEQVCWLIGFIEQKDENLNQLILKILRAESAAYPLSCFTGGWNCQNDKGTTPLGAAIECCGPDHEITKLLIERGAKIAFFEFQKREIPEAVTRSSSFSAE